jgi:DNA-binding CsgD family transcriptional regulator
MLLDVMASNTSNVSITCIQLKIYAEMGLRSNDEVILRSVLERADRIERDVPLKSPDSHLLMCARACAAAGLKDADTSREYRKALLRHTGSVNLHLGGPFYDSLLGDLAHTEGDFDGATNHFEHALLLAQRAELPVGVYLEAERFVVHLLKLSTAKAVARARKRLADASEVALSHELNALHARLVQLQTGTTGKKVLNAAGLTKREVEILSMIAVGRSNPEIGKELFITINTVLRYVSNIFNKVGAKNRFEAAAFARDNDLINSNSV